MLLGPAFDIRTRAGGAGGEGITVDRHGAELLVMAGARLGVGVDDGRDGEHRHGDDPDDGFHALKRDTTRSPIRGSIGLGRSLHPHRALRFDPWGVPGPTPTRSRATRLHRRSGRVAFRREAAGVPEARGRRAVSGLRDLGPDLQSVPVQTFVLGTAETWSR